MPLVTVDVRRLFYMALQQLLQRCRCNLLMHNNNNIIITLITVAIITSVLVFVLVKDATSGDICIVSGSSC